MLLTIFVKSQVSNTTSFYVNALKTLIVNEDSIKATTQISENDTIMVTKDFLLSISGSGNGWDSLAWYPSRGEIVWWYGGSRIDSINIDGRYVLLSDSTSQYLTADSINNLISSSGMKTVYELTLPAASTIDGRIIGAVEGVDYPSGWVLDSGNDPADLEIIHNVWKRAANVNVFYNVSGTEFRQLVNFNNAYTGILTPSLSTLRIEGLTTIQKEIKIYIIFTQ